jgi:ADP-ribose pyrophosphatase
MKAKPVEPGVPSADAHLIETCLDGRQVYRGKFLDVRRDIVALPDGEQAEREYIKHPGAVMIVPLLDDGRLLLERQYRHPMGRVMLEFPAGKLDAGEAVMDCAQRELREETGHRAREWAYAGILHNAIAYSDEGIHICFARGLLAGDQALDAGEFLELTIKTAAELEALAVSGELSDAKTLIGLQWLQRWQAGAWTPQWRQFA